MTRYPKTGKRTKWTILELHAITPDWAGDTLSDSEGLSGQVLALKDGSVSIRFKYAFRWAGKLCWHYCGTFPDTGLAKIRQNRDTARDLVKQGINPNDHKKAARIEAQAAIQATIEQAEKERIKNQTVNDLFDTWITDGVARQDGNAELKRLFAKDIIPAIGDLAISALTDTDILTMLRGVMKRGVVRQAVVIYNAVNQMLSWGQKRQPWRGLLTDGNPCDLVDVNKLLPADYEEERDRILSPEEICELRDIFQRMDDEWQNAPDRRAAPRPLVITTQIALWLCLGTICRIGELLMARWEHVDLDAGVWFIPRENVKGTRAKKQEHYVFLSDFTRAQFKALKEQNPNSEFCFPSKNHEETQTHVCVKTVSKQAGDRQTRFKQRKPLSNRRHDDSLVLAQGLNGAWTPHDLRRTGATMMQALGVPLDIIDRCQNHVLAGSKVRRHYLHHDYADEKREAWERLGAEIERVLGQS